MVAFHPSGDATAQLRRVESRLRTVASTADERLTELTLSGIKAGGKRLRPALVVCAALAIGGRDALGERVVEAAAAVELLHLASLYHDDVLDSAAIRRERPSANALWGNHAAVLGGDVLLAHAYSVAAGLGAAELRRLSHTLTALCSGQIAESSAQFDAAREVAHYDASIRGKTAALLATSCWLGATTAGGSPRAADALACFGMELGIAFQIVDDVLDLYGHGLQIGKPAGSDLRVGVFTLPVLLTLQRDPTLVELLVEGIDERGVGEVARRVHAAGADRRAVARALDHLQIAFARLGDPAFLPDGVRLLMTIGELVLEPLDRLGLGAGRSRPAQPEVRVA
jgi:heptaprenyl diphosphate synthase